MSSARASIGRLQSMLAFIPDDEPETSTLPELGLAKEEDRDAMMA